MWNAFHNRFRGCPGARPRYRPASLLADGGYNAPYERPTARSLPPQTVHRSLSGRPGRLAAADVQRVDHGRLRLHQRLVRRTGQAHVEPAGLDLRAGVDGPLRPDGGLRMARLASGGLVPAKDRAPPVPPPVVAQRPVDAPFLRPTPARLVAGRDPGSLGSHSGDPADLLACRSARQPPIAPLRRLGGLRHRAQLDDLANELSVHHPSLTGLTNGSGYTSYNISKFGFVMPCWYLVSKQFELPMTHDSHQRVILHVHKSKHLR